MISHRWRMAPGGAAAGAAALVLACGGGGNGTGPTPTPTVAQVVITSPSAAPTLRTLGRTVQFTAEPRDQSGAVVPGKSIVWTSSSSAVATISSSTGLATAVGNGTTLIRASVDGKFAEVTLTVNQLVAQVVVTPGAHTFAAVGRTRQFAAEPRDSNGSAVGGKTATWSSSNTSVVTVSTSGVATAVANGTGQVQATVDGVTGSGTVTVDLVAASLSLSALQTFTRISQAKTVTPTVRDSGGTAIANPNLSWASKNTAVATVSGTGVVTSVADGSTYVVATATGGVKDSVPVTVAAVANAVSITPTPVPFGAIGSTRQLAASVLDSGGTAIAGRTVTWSGTSHGSASVSASGLVTSVAAGATPDTAIASASGPVVPIEGRAPITVTQVVHSIAVTSARDTLFTAGRTLQFSAAAADSNATAIPGTTFTWASSATGVASVDATGVATAVGDGTAQIRAAASGVTGSKNLVVRRYALVFSMSRTLDTLTAIGATLSYAGTAQDSSGASVTISWLSRSTSVATVSPATGSSTTATAAGNGTTRIVASGGTRSDSATLVVNSPAVSFIASIQPIFDANCISCHSGTNPPEGLNLTSNAFSRIVSVSSTQQPARFRVLPGNPDNSYLYMKITGAAGITGSRMPLGGPFLDAATTNLIRTWILQGANP